MTNYTIGRRLEYLCRDELQAQGYTVIRSAGSKGAIDLCAIRGDAIILIQVKKSARDVAEGVKALQAVSVPSNVTRQVWQREYPKGTQRGGWRIVTVDALP